MLVVGGEDRTEIPKLPAEPVDDGDQVAEPAAAPTAPPNSSRRRRSPQALPPPDPDFADAPPVEPPAADSVTEAQLVRAFYWLYRGWCRVLGAEVDAKHSDFQDLGKAWLDLARKVPGIRWMIAAVGPIFTFTDLLDKMAIAWSVRSRFRAGFRVPNWRERSQTGAEAPDAHVVDGSAGAP